MLIENKILPKSISDLYEDLIDSSYQKISSKEKKVIYQSLVIAFNGHDGQIRKSGEPYIHHPIEVAKIVAKDIGLDYISIASALLHDVVEDTDVTFKDLNESVGNEISRIVNGLTKISTLKKNEDYSIQAENYRRMLLTLHSDIRVILIKTADRLHNMRTIDFLSKAKQDQMASESLYIYAPLAHRVGLYNIKNELEDLSLRILETRKYNLIKNKIDKEFVNQEKYVETFKSLINNSLDDQKIKYSIIGRNKSIYSIHNKIQKKNISFDEVYDRFAIRIIYNSISPNLKLKTKEISSSHKQGKHTTTYAEMFDLDSNIKIIDTPGIRGFGLVDITKYELGDFFPEFFEAKQKCKFKNCLHLDEPDCNVKNKIKQGEIFESRYNTYLDMLKDQNIYRKSDEASNTES